MIVGKRSPLYEAWCEIFGSPQRTDIPQYSQLSINPRHFAGKFVFFRGQEPA
ncbi:hypothetical protein [Nostoc sp. WHI]|uniref:hypothetical protein n=1 Tax=Nostoc sp. WHI TaxID=2650611 RepID=UPI0018C4D9BC|nr:hypothetical protein [Nostoc sp. WHI]